MPRACTICSHAQRVELETAVLAGTSIRATAKANGISWSALQRHMRHVPAIVAQRTSVEERQAIAAGSLKVRVEALIADMGRIVKAAEEGKNYQAALAGLRSQLQCLELLGQLTGELLNGVGEFVPGTAAAGAAASASVTVNLPTPTKHTKEEFFELIREIYGLPPKVQRSKLDPIM